MGKKLSINKCYLFWPSRYCRCIFCTTVNLSSLAGEVWGRKMTFISPEIQIVREVNLIKLD